VEAIVKAGGTVQYDYEFDETGAFIQGSQSTVPVWLRKSLGDDFFCDVIWVKLGYTQVTDAGLVHLEGLTSLESLGLWSTEVTDAGLEHVKGLTMRNRARPCQERLLSGRMSGIAVAINRGLGAGQGYAA